MEYAANKGISIESCGGRMVFGTEICGGRMVFGTEFAGERTERNT